MKKAIIIVLAVLAVTLTVFCGCGKEPDSVSTEPATTKSQNEPDTTSPTEESVNDSQYIPDNTEENELEILTVPQTDAYAEETQPTESTAQITEPTVNDNTQGETKIELPFVPIN